MSISGRRKARATKKSGDAVPSNLPTTIVWVATTGSDSNPGTEAAPLKTLDAANSKVASIISGGRPADGIMVNIMPGRYPHSSRLTLTSNTSGTASSPVIWRGAGSGVVLTGSVDIPAGALQAVPGGVASLIPASLRSQVKMVDLAALGVTTPAETIPMSTWDPTPARITTDGTMLTPARYPTTGWLNVEAGSISSAAGCVFKETDTTVLSWAGQTSGALLYTQPVFQWATQIMPVTGIDATAQTITTNVESTYGAPDPAIGRYHFFNLPQALDQPSECYIDTAAGKAYFVPGAVNSVAVLEDHIISCWQASYVEFHNLTFAESRFTGLHIGSSDHITVRNCTFANLNAALILDGATDCLIDEITVHDVACSGVTIGGGVRPPLIRGNNTLQNSTIRRCARRAYNYSPGVILLGVGNSVLHNELADSPHTLLILYGNDHLIQDNWLHHGVMDNSDAGAIYAGAEWTERGNVVNRNWFSDIGTTDERYQISVFLDDCESGFTVTNNIIVNGKRPFHHCGRDNFFSNNVILDCLDIAYYVGNWGSNSGNQANLTNKYNAIINDAAYNAALWSQYPHFTSILSDSPMTPKYNTISNCLITGTPAGYIETSAPVPQVTISGLQTPTAAQLGVTAATQTVASSSIIITGSGSFQGIDVSKIRGVSVS